MLLATHSCRVGSASAEASCDGADRYAALADARWIYSTWWANSAVVIQNDSPSTFGDSGGIELDNVSIVQRLGDQRGWLCTHVDASTSFEGVRGGVTVQPAAACKFELGKPADAAGLANISVACK